MPKIVITEKDNTGSVQYQDTSNVVYVIGPATASAEPRLYSTAAEFEADGNLLKESVSNPDNPSVSYYVAHRLLQLGMPVLYQAIAKGDIASKFPDFTALEDKSRYDIRFIFLGDYGYGSSDDSVTPEATAQARYANAWKAAAARGDCVALIDVLSDNDAASSGSVVGGMREAIEAISAPPSPADTFAAAFAPWINVDFGEGVAMAVPGSAGYLLAYAHSLQDGNPMWYAIAGTFRGTIPELTGVTYELSNAECEMLQARAADGEVGLDDAGDNVGRAINPIAKRNPYGYIIWGNRTLRDNGANEGSLASESLPATAFLNVRLLATEVSKTAYAAATRYNFEQNNNVLWANFKSMVTPLLDRMQSGNGINGYRITRLSTEKRGRIRARITILPIEAVEDFDIEIYMENSIAEVTE